MRSLESAVSILLAILGAYLAIGVVVSAWLQAGGLRRFDPGVEKTSPLFRLLITPGLVALWPALLRRAFARATTPPDSDRPVPAARLRARHRLFTTALAIVIPPVVAVGLIMRPGDTIHAGTLSVIADGTTRYDDLGLVLSYDAAADAPTLEVALERPLPLSQPALYWFPETVSDRTIATAQLVGVLGHTGQHHFPLNERIVRTPGYFAVLSMDTGVGLATPLRIGGAS